MTPTGWRSRIVGYKEMDPTQLLSNPKNWRIHPRQQAEALLGVLQEVGVVQNIIVNVHPNEHGIPADVVVDGHLRVALALQQQQPRIPVTCVDLTEDEEALILLTLDPIAAAAATDRQQLDALLRQVQTGDAGVQQLLTDLAQREGLYTEGLPERELVPVALGHPTIHVQVDPDTLARYTTLMAHLDGSDEPERFTQLIELAEEGWDYHRDDGLRNSR